MDQIKVTVAAATVAAATVAWSRVSVAATSIAWSRVSATVTAAIASIAHVLAFGFSRLQIIAGISYCHQSHNDQRNL